MADKFQKLRGMGDWGNHLANLLTFLTTNWVVVVSTLFGIGTGAIGWLRSFALTPAVYTGAGAFLAALWTIVGLTVLIDRRKPRLTKTHLDYRYGLTFEGLSPNFVPTNYPVDNAGALQFLAAVRNFSPGPINYSLEAADIRIGTRAIPKYKPNSVAGYMARAAGRAVRPEAFAPGTMKEFFGKGIQKGTADFSFTYGPPDGPRVRRLRINLEIFISLPEDGDHEKGPIGYSDNILSEIDEPISTH